MWIKILTNTVLEDYINEQLQPFNNDPELYQSVKSLMQVSHDYLSAADEEIKKESGNWLNYVQNEIKVTPQEIADLKKIYL